MAKKPKKAQTPKTSEAPETIAAGGVQFWRGVVREILPKEKEEWHVGEVATALKLQTELLTKHWADASRIADKSEGRTVSLSISIKIDRKEIPPVVKVSVGFSESHGGKAASDVPDPAQDELPGLTRSEPVTVRDSTPLPPEDPEDR